MMLGQHGRLGNQLWQIAATVGLAHQGGQDVGFPSWKYQQFFNVPQELFGKSPEPEDVDPDRVHMQDVRCLHGVESMLRKWFTPTMEMRSTLTVKYPWFLQVAHPVAIHVRRGDALGREQWHPVAGMTFYEKAMALVRERIEDPTFLIFSDGIGWCRENFVGDEYVFVSPLGIEHDRTEENDVDHEEFFLMSMCEDHIISNSTFSWWAAWMSNPAPIYPTQWFGPSYPELQACFQALFILPGWIGVQS